MKKLLLLGGLRYLIPVIKAAHEENIHVITCDYLPNNIAHRYSDEYHNVSIIDKEAVLRLSQELRIDGIMSFAVDPGVVTAAYVAEKMGLPSCGPYESVKILQDKSLFRKFLKDNNFIVPQAKSYSNIADALDDINNLSLPVIVKPVDSAGSKGVSKISTPEQAAPALKLAFQNSISKKIIIEEFIEKKGFSSDSDSFSVDGEMKFLSFSNQMFDNESSNPYTPASYSWPSSLSSENQQILENEIQRLVSLLKMKTSVYNIEVRESTAGNPYIMELSPRGGGNRLSEMLKYATNQDLIKNAVRAAINEKIDVISMPVYDGNWAEVIIHSPKNGVFKELVIDNDVNHNYVKEIDLWVKENDKVNEFHGANDAIGTIVLNFDSQKQLFEMMQSQYNWLNIIVK